jgi:hypothetical protein
METMFSQYLLAAVAFASRAILPFCAGRNLPAGTIKQNFAAAGVWTAGADATAQLRRGDRRGGGAAECRVRGASRGRQVLGNIQGAALDIRCNPQLPDCAIRQSDNDVIDAVGYAVKGR